jgi:hypothetical protein
MVTEIVEFEKYLASLSANLHVADVIKDEIYNEIKQNLYDKYNEYLIKGCGIGPGIASTLESFEAPEDLAEMFNEIHGTGIVLQRAIVFLQNRKILLAALVATILMAFII